MRKPRTRNYINNKDFYLSMKKYKEEVIYAEENGLTKPMIPRYVGECLMKIAENLAKKPNFGGYSFVDEMILDGIENAIKYIDKFDHINYDNPFAYFTQFMKNSFVKRINDERRQRDIKRDNLVHLSIMSDDPGMIGDLSSKNRLPNLFREEEVVQSPVQKEIKKSVSNNVTKFIEE